MTEPTPPPSPNWIHRGFAVLLCAQLALLWLQGMQLNRQHHDLAGIREDLQSLAETLDQNSNAAAEEGDGYAPARAPRHPRSPLQRVHRQEEKQDGKNEGDSRADQDLKAAQDSARKAVADARKAQSQLSLSENARIAEEKAKIKEAHAAWEMWALAAGALVLGALVLRGWLKARDE